MKTLISDLDGVLVDTNGLHESCFLEAVERSGFTVGDRREELLGLPTRLKIERLGIPLEFRKAIADLKQRLTLERVGGFVQFDAGIFELFSRLKADGVNLAIGTNCVRSFAELVVGTLRLPVHLIVSNEDVTNPKPDPEMYVKATKHFGSLPNETVICEDSPVGLAAAYASGARVYQVKDPSEMRYERLQAFLNQT